MSIIRDPLSAADKQRFGITHILGAGHEGTVYATDHDTVLKVVYLNGWREQAAAEALQQLAGRHPIVPRVYGVGTLRGLLGAQVWVEREPLNDLQLDEQTEIAIFADDVGRVLSNVPGAQLVTRRPSYVPMRDWKLLTQMMKGFLWLKKYGIELEDHNNSENWGLRGDGTVALRDLGGVAVVRETFERMRKS